MDVDEYTATSLSVKTLIFNYTSTTRFVAGWKIPNRPTEKLPTIAPLSLQEWSIVGGGGDEQIKFNCDRFRREDSDGKSMEEGPRARSVRSESRDKQIGQIIIHEDEARIIWPNNEKPQNRCPTFTARSFVKDNNVQVDIRQADGPSTSFEGIVELIITLYTG